MGSAGLGALARSARRAAETEVAALVDELLDLLGVARPKQAGEAA